MSVLDSVILEIFKNPQEKKILKESKNLIKHLLIC